MDKILVIGAGGQLGTELVDTLRKQYGLENVIASDIKSIEDTHHQEPYEELDALDYQRMQDIVSKHKVNQIYHLAAVLSAVGESKPLWAWDINIKSLLNVLELARHGEIDKVFWPSSIAVFGPDTPRDLTPQMTIMNPNTIYGISKLAGERWCEYYHNKYGVDVRSIRYPGLIGYKAQPGGGTTDYAVDIFFKAINNEQFICFLQEDTKLPMMYMDDAIRGTIELMKAHKDKLSIRSSYNMSAMSFTPKELILQVKKHFPNLSVVFAPDYRQQIAESWPKGIDDSIARNDWGWKEEFNLEQMTDEITSGLAMQLSR